MRFDWSSVDCLAILTVDRLSTRNPDAFGVDLQEISFTVRAGEILGLGGIAGNGQTELLQALIGETRTRPGAVRLNGLDVGALGPTARRRRGLLATPEERLGHGAAPMMSLSRNVLLTARARQDLSAGGFLRFGKARRFAQQVIQAFDVRTSGTESEARALSGGNLQKFIVGRELLQKPVCYVVLQPTWGVDAAAAAAIRKALQELAAAGGAVVLISQDLDELREISHSFAVIAGGRLSTPRPTASVTVEEIGRLMERAA